MKGELTLESVAREFTKWRSERGGDRRMPPDLLRSAALVAEKTSVAEVAGRLGLNHTRLSQSVALLQNERLALAPVVSNETLRKKDQTQALSALTFTKVDSHEAHVPQESASRKQRVYAQFLLPGAVRCEVTSLRAFRVLCKTVLKGNA